MPSVNCLILVANTNQCMIIIVYAHAGAGLWDASDFFYNTSSFQALASGDIGTIYCRSSSFSSNVGQWISPQGLDITRNFTDPFSIQFINGPGYPSYNTFQLQNPSLQPFTSTYNGVYSCIVPDDQGVMQTLHIGIYSHAYSGRKFFCYIKLM